MALRRAHFIRLLRVIPSEKRTLNYYMIERSFRVEGWPSDALISFACSGSSRARKGLSIIISWRGLFESKDGPPTRSFHSLAQGHPEREKDSQLLYHGEVFSSRRMALRRAHFIRLLRVIPSEKRTLNYYMIERSFRVQPGRHKRKSPSKMVGFSASGSPVESKKISLTSYAP